MKVIQTKLIKPELESVMVELTVREVEVLRRLLGAAHDPDMRRYPSHAAPFRDLISGFCDELVRRHGLDELLDWEPWYSPRS